MPSLVIDTNLPQDKFTKEVFDRLTHVLAETLSKPLGYCAVQVRASQMMTWAGTSEPCALIKILSIGRLGVEENKKHSKVIMDEMSKLGVAGDRIYIHFIDPKPEEIGYNFSTFHGIL